MRWLATFRGVALMAVLMTAGAARAEQMVLFDITYTHTGERNFHHEVKAPTLMQPSNWTAPINYAMGTIHFYQEVETKPTPRVTIIDFCFISSGGYGCIETLPYTTTGVHETMRGMAPSGDWYQRNQINFTTKLNSIELVIKDPATYTNGCPGGDCVPSKMRFVATIVSPGGTYQKPAPGPGFGGMTGGGSDGGASPTPDAASSGTVDAGAATPDVAEPEPEVDAAVAPPVKVDAAPSMDPKPPTKADAGSSSKPPKTDPPAEEPDPTPPRKASSGCAVGGGAAGGAILLAIVLVPALRRRRR
jgi:MYXO-CTERM domain-containing protein